MMKNITFSADDRIIDMARKKARQHNTTINELFKQWLVSYTKEKGLLNEYDNFINNIDYAHSGRSFSRDELNER